MDIHHQLYKTKRLWKTPISCFTDEMYFDILWAKSEGLIELEFEDQEFEDKANETFLKIMENLDW